MSIIAKTLRMLGVWAQEAPDVAGNPINGVTYRNTAISEAEIKEGWKFQTRVDSSQLNEVLFRLTSLMNMLETHGVFPYCATTAYEIGSRVLWTDGLIYSAKAGGLLGSPAAAPANWHQGGAELIAHTGLFSAHGAVDTATANRIALRRGDGKLAGDILGNAASATKALVGATFIAEKNAQTSYSTGGLEVRSASGDVYLGLHASGDTAAALRHMRGTSGISVVGSTGEFANFQAGLFMGPLQGNASSADYATNATNATNAGNADSVDGQHFNWQDNGPGRTYLWAADTNGQSYLVQRSAIAVNYANTAGSAPANGGTSAACSGNAATATNATNFINAFSQSLGANGYQKIAGGLLLQWGRASYSTPTAFPIAFPNACLHFSGIEAQAIANTDNDQPFNLTNTLFEIRRFEVSSASSLRFLWFALGY